MKTIRNLWIVSHGVVYPANAVESVSNTFHRENNNTQSQLSPMRLPILPHPRLRTPPSSCLYIICSSCRFHRCTDSCDSFPCMIFTVAAQDASDASRGLASEKKIFVTVLNSISPSGPLHQMCMGSQSSA